MSAFNRTAKPSAKRINQSSRERDSSGTTRVRAKRGAGDGADSPTRATEGSEAARPKKRQKKTSTTVFRAVVDAYNYKKNEY